MQFLINCYVMSFIFSLIPLKFYTFTQNIFEVLRRKISGSLNKVYKIYALLKE